jgi:hypothetical protein
MAGLEATPGLPCNSGGNVLTAAWKWYIHGVIATELKPIDICDAASDLGEDRQP